MNKTTRSVAHYTPNLLVIITKTVVSWEDNWNKWRCTRFVIFNHPDSVCTNKFRCIRIRVAEKASWGSGSGSTIIIFMHDHFISQACCVIMNEKRVWEPIRRRCMCSWNSNSLFEKQISLISMYTLTGFSW